MPDAQLQKLGLLGYTYTGYGAQVSYQQLDNVLFPTTGFRYSAAASVGNKTFTKSIVGREGRDSLSKTNLQLMAKASVERYSLVGKNLVLVLKGGAGYLGTGQGKGGIGASNLLATNELFRLGGLTTIRGFAENFFFASSYGTATAELRAFTAPQTFFSVFVDQGLIGQQNFLGNNVSYCTGIGVGVSFTVPAGLFNLNYALGQTAGLPFSFDTSKVHFGYVARF